jgi:hypothetical protein
MKDGYLPAGVRIKVQASSSAKALSISAQIDGQTADIKVWEKSSNEPVEGVAVYALNADEKESNNPLPHTSNNDNSTVKTDKPASALAKFLSQVTRNNDRIQNQTNAARGKGTLVGYTDSNGQLVYKFDSEGEYTFTAFKDGYKMASTHLTYALSGTTVN